jgi:hypothetical protein
MSFAVRTRIGPAVGAQTWPPIVARGNFKQTAEAPASSSPEWVRAPKLLSKARRVSSVAMPVILAKVFAVRFKLLSLRVRMARTGNSVGTPPANLGQHTNHTLLDLA